MKRPALLVLVVLAACASEPEKLAPPKPAPLAPPALDAKLPADYAGLHNVVTYATDLYSGSAPEGAEGFETLARLGIRTIVSVDGAKPDVAAAKAHGIRYVHLPITYAGMEKPRALEIARALRDLPGPIYIHCHHGKHRSAGALGVATVTLGLATPEQATERMKVSGTSPHYKGLYACTAAATAASPAELAAASTEFPEVYKTRGLVQCMVDIDLATDQLRAIEKAGWKAPPSHPDLVPAAIGGRLADLLRNLADDEEVKRKGGEFAALLAESARHAQAAEDAILAGADASPSFKLATQSCTKCHDKFRD